ncbi:ATPase, partial [Amycolatopsis sp. NPDC000673]
MTGPSEETAGEQQSEQAQEPAAMFSEERTDSTPHPGTGPYDAQPTQVVDPPPQGAYQPLPQPGGYQAHYDQNLPPLQPPAQQQPYAAPGGYQQQPAAPAGTPVPAPGAVPAA